jgi:hypothetical protein
MTPTVNADQVDLFLEVAEVQRRREEVCRLWGCTPEEAPRLDTPLRWKAWDVWVRSESGTAREFFRECSRILNIFRDAVERHIKCDVDFLAMPSWPDHTYIAKRCGIVAGDAILSLLPFNPSMVACVADDVIRDWKLDARRATAVQAYVWWADWHRKRPIAPDILAIYAHYVMWLMTGWESPSDEKERDATIGQSVVTVDGPRGPMSLPSHGLLVPGNIDLRTGPIVLGTDGVIALSTTFMFSDPQGRTGLFPMMDAQGNTLSVRDALAYWTAREQMLGIFDTREHAEAYNAALVACLSEQFWGPAV